MRYMLMIYGNDEDWTTLPAETLDPAFAEFASFTSDLRRESAYVVDEALQPSSRTSTIKIVDGEAHVSDGPYIASRQQIAGFYLIDVDSTEKAIEWGERLARLDGGPIEVRPVIEF